MSDDLIKKEEAKEAVCKGCLKDWEICHHHWDCPMLTNLETLPTADRPQGAWLDAGGNLWGCSNCGMEIYSESERDRNEFHKWCSRCGARMKGADDGTDNI